MSVEIRGREISQAVSPVKDESLNQMSGQKEQRRGQIQETVRRRIHQDLRLVRCG